MNRRIAGILFTVVMAMIISRPTHALGQPPPQQPPATAPAPPASQASRGTANSTVRLQIVLSTFNGDKRVSSQPYTMLVSMGQAGSLAVGAEVPIPTGIDQAYQMQRVGTDLQARVNNVSEDKYELILTVTDRSHFINPNPEPGREKLAGVPSFRNFTTSSRVILSNGETVQFMSALDPASNQTFRIDVTLTLGNK